MAEQLNQESEGRDREIREEIENQALSIPESRLTIEEKIRIASLEDDAATATSERRAEILAEIKKVESRFGKDEDKLSLEARAARVSSFEVSGFSTKIKEVAKKPEVKDLLKDIDAAEENRDMATAKTKRAELARHTEEIPWLDDKDMAELAEQLVPACFHKFFEKHCQLVYDPSGETAMKAPTQQGEKLVFSFGKKSLYQEVKFNDGTKAEVIKPIKLQFQLGRMLGTLLKTPPNWDEVRKTIKIQKDKEMPEWEEFVALCLIDRKRANELSEECVKRFENMLMEFDRMAGEGIDIKDELEKPGDRAFDDPNDLEEGVNKMGLLRRLLFNNRFQTRVREIYREKRIWYDMALSELELEESKLITTRQEHVSDRDKRLKVYLTTGDRSGARGLILADSSTSDSRWWRYHLYLSYFDQKYIHSNGEEITQESYDFLVRCTRTSHQAKRSGSKPGEYKMVVEKDGTKKFKRMDRAEWNKAAYDEVGKLSSRNVLNTADEAFDWMQCNGRFMELDETFGGNAPLAFRQRWLQDMESHQWDAKEGEKWQFETGNMHSHAVGLPEWLTKNAFNKGREVQKLDPDMLACIARMTATLELSEEASDPKKGDPKKSVIGKYIRNPFAGAEHARGIQKELVAFYQQRVLEYKEYRAGGGPAIAGYELFIKMVNDYKRVELAGIEQYAREGTETDREIIKKLGLIAKLEEEEAYEVDQVIKDEPNIKLARDAGDTAKKYTEVKRIKKQTEKGFFGEKDFIGELDKHGSKIPEELKKWLKKDPSRLLDLLTYPEITSKEVAREILTEEDTNIIDSSGRFISLADRIERDSVPVLTRYFSENRSKILAMIKTAEWIDKNDLKPFLDTLSDSDRLRTELALQKTETAEEIDKKVSEIVALAETDLDQAKDLYQETFDGKGAGKLKPDGIEGQCEAAGVLKKEEEEKKSKLRVIQREKQKIQNILRILDPKRSLDKDKGVSIAPLDDSEKRDLERGVISLKLLPELLSDDAMAKERLSFFQDMPAGDARTYLTLKAYEVGLQIKEQEEKAENEKRNPKKGEKPEKPEEEPEIDYAESTESPD